MIVSDFLFFPGQREPGPDNELHPLRPRRHSDRPSHAGDRVGAEQPLRSFGLSGLRSRRACRRRRIPAPTAATSGHGASAATSRAARSSTTGAIPTASWSSTSATATCSTPPWSRAGRRSPPRGSPSGDLPSPRISSASDPKALPHEARSMITALRGDNEFDLNRLRRPPESSQLMTISILRTNDAWWVQTPTGAAKITTTAATTGELLADRAAIDAAAAQSPTPCPSRASNSSRR